MISSGLIQTRERIASACRRAGRDPAEVTLVCATKTVSAEAVRAAYERGARHFGENYGQELRDKARALADLADLRWHFIGPLQRNKIKYVVGTAVLVHSVDSIELLQAIERRAAALWPSGVQELLVQLNLAEEPSKSGLKAEELEALLDAFAECPHCRCVGLMMMPPFFDCPDEARPLFARLRALREQMSVQARRGVDLRHLSMGMSGDFEVAIEEGATLVRVGTAIFGTRTG